MRNSGLVAALAVIASLSGCVAAGPEETQATQNPTPTPTQTQSAAPTPTQTDSESNKPLPCDQDLEKSISATIEAQTKAFSEADFELAYSLASSSFRATVSLEQFVQIINGSYGPLISSSSLAFSDCFSDEKQQIGVINAKFIQANNEVYGLRYLMLNTDEGWRVQGASNLAVVGEGA